MDQLSAMRVFVSVADNGSFSAAAKALKLPLSSVSRKISELEEYLSAQLLTRTTRRLSLTESGTRFLEASRRILDDLNEAERQVSDEFIKPTGTLTITAPVFFGRLHLLPIVHDFMNAYPDVHINLQFADHVVDLLGQHVDLGIRIGMLADSSMIAKPLGTLERIICGSPEYFEKMGVPQSPDDLIHHDCITFNKIDAREGWRFAVDNTVRFYPVKSRLMVTSTEASVESAVNHMGLAHLLSYQAASYIKAGKLKLALNGYGNQSNPVSFVYPQGRMVPVKLRSFIDFATPLLKKRLKEVASDCGLLA
jgi:DNA-binding transcriptional LysR family regulator